jgi:quercetin dioxygenase-like cupin family protein
MAKKKSSKAHVSRAATKNVATKSAMTKSAAAKKKSAARTVAAKSAPNKSAPNRSIARKQIKSRGRAPMAAKRARPKQRIAISHHREEDFKADGLRAYAKYRDLGIAEASNGAARAHVIRLIGPCNPQEVSKLHFHDIDFQLVYVLKGWVKTYMEGEGETMMQEGSAWTQPPRIRHMILDYSDDVELLEIILPAEFKTVELAA